jgi:hypothetical protein
MSDKAPPSQDGELYIEEDDGSLVRVGEVPERVRKSGKPLLPNRLPGNFFQRQLMKLVKPRHTANKRRPIHLHIHKT